MQVWEADRDAYIRRYEKAQKPLSSFEADISRYLQCIDEIRGEDGATNMRFLRIDCGPLKLTLVGHCEAWVSKFTGLLGQLAATELRTLHTYFRCAGRWWWCVCVCMCVCVCVGGFANNSAN